MSLFLGGSKDEGVADVNIVRQFLAGILAGGITSGTAITTMLQETALTAISAGEWLSIAIGGLTAAAAGWRTLLTEPKK